MESDTHRIHTTLTEFLILTFALTVPADPAEPTDRTTDEQSDKLHAELIQLHGSDTCPRYDILTEPHYWATTLTVPAMPAMPRPLNSVCRADRTAGGALCLHSDP